jgi:hypothetical protein
VEKGDKRPENVTFKIYTAKLQFLPMSRKHIKGKTVGVREHSVEQNTLFRRKEGEVTGLWRDVHNQFHNLYSSLGNYIKSSRMRWERHVAHMRELTNYLHGAESFLRS